MDGDRRERDLLVSDQMVSRVAGSVAAAARTAVAMPAIRQREDAWRRPTQLKAAASVIHSQGGALSAESAAKSAMPQSEPTRFKP